MIYIENNNKHAAFHFSVEEFLMRNPKAEPVIMLWQTDKCVMIGTNQVVYAEVDLEYAERENMQIVRRSSGGGTIFTDKGTLLYTMIQPYIEGSEVKQLAKDTIVGAVERALNKMGVPAVLEGRNDILANGKKISGIAQYVRNGMLCTHGSLLYDADLTRLARVLNVDDEKIHSKAIRSVRSRVTNIKDYLGILTSEFRENLKQYLISEFAANEYTLTEYDLLEIEKICREKYANDTWTFGSSPKFSISYSKRFPEGKVDIYLDIVKGIIASCSIRGDFLSVCPIGELEEKLNGVAFDYNAIADRLNEVSLELYIGGITKEQFLSCIVGREAAE